MFKPDLHQLPGKDLEIACDDVRICGPTVATLIHHGSAPGPYVPELHLLNWRRTTGHFGWLVGHMTSTAGTAFELLDERTVLVLNPGYRGMPINPSLAIWTFPADECPRGDNRREDFSGHPGVLLAELSLPPTARQVTKAWISPQRGAHTTRATGGSPWAPDGGRGLLRISLWLDEERYDLYVLRETVLACVREGMERIKGGFRPPFDRKKLQRDDRRNARCAVYHCKCHGAMGGMRLALPQHAERFESEDEQGRTFWANDVDLVARQYEWDAWGPENARLVKGDTVCDKYSVSGYHDVRLVMDEGKPVGYEVLDFSPASVERDTQRDVMPEGVERTASDSAIVKTGGLWKNDVETRLPCVCIRRMGALPGLQEGEYSVMSDEQRIILGVHTKLDTEGIEQYRRDYVVMCM